MDELETTLYSLLINGDHDSLMVANDLAIELNCGLPILYIGRGPVPKAARTGIEYVLRAKISGHYGLSRVGIIGAECRAFTGILSYMWAGSARWL